MKEFIEAVRQYPCLWNTELKEYRDMKKKDAVWKRIADKSKRPEIHNINTAKAEWKKLRDSHRDSMKRAKASTIGQAAVCNKWKFAELMEFLLPFMRNRKSSRNVRSTEDSLSHQHASTNLQPFTPKSEDLDSSCHSNSLSRQQDFSEYILPEQNVESNQNSDQQRVSESRKRKADNDGDFFESLKEMLKEVDENSNRRCEERNQRRIIELLDTKKNKQPLDLFFESMCETTKQFPTWLQNSVKKKIFTIVSEAEDSFESVKS